MEITKQQLIDALLDMVTHYCYMLERKGYWEIYDNGLSSNERAISVLEDLGIIYSVGRYYRMKKSVKF